MKIAIRQKKYEKSLMETFFPKMMHETKGNETANELPQEREIKSRRRFTKRNSPDSHRSCEEDRRVLITSNAMSCHCLPGAYCPAFTALIAPSRAPRRSFRITYSGASENAVLRWRVGSVPSPVTRRIAHRPPVRPFVRPVTRLTSKTASIFNSYLHRAPPRALL